MQKVLVNNLRVQCLQPKQKLCCIEHISDFFYPRPFLRTLLFLYRRIISHTYLKRILWCVCERCTCMTYEFSNNLAHSAMWSLFPVWLLNLFTLTQLRTHEKASYWLIINFRLNKLLIHAIEQWLSFPIVYYNHVFSQMDTVGSWHLFKTFCSEGFNLSSHFICINNALKNKIIESCDILLIDYIM